jgi:hypothetical protein
MYTLKTTMAIGKLPESIPTIPDLGNLLPQQKPEEVIGFQIDQEHSTGLRPVFR